MTGIDGPDVAAGAPLPDRPVDPGWLALREPADARARDGVADLLLPHLRGWLRARLTGSDTCPLSGLRVVDLGSGTGANPRWLAPRLAGLGAVQHWLLVDHDPRLTVHGPDPTPDSVPIELTRLHADVVDLPEVLSGIGSDRVDLVTAAALLDLLDGERLAAVIDAVVGQAAAALFSLTVTGEVRFDPVDPLDDALAAAFDAHQRRDGRLGPDSGAAAAAGFCGQGWTVWQAATPWRVPPAEMPLVEVPLVEAYLDGRVEAAVEWRPDLAGPAADWLGRRVTQLRRGALSVVVGHVDLLAVP